MAVTDSVFSEAEVRKIGIKMEGAEKADVLECVGTWEEELEVKTVTKNCRGVVAKTRTKGTGNGTITASMHMPQDIFADMYGMNQIGLKDGVIAYGQDSLHPVMTVTCLVLDEDDNEKYKAYPKCSIQAALSRSVENGAEEIAEIELEIAVMPDDYGNGMYEAVATDIDEDTANQWLEGFTPELVMQEA